MAAIIVVGAQWGDEGKGKATDILGGRVDYVVKPNGGNNAGHTVVVGEEKFELKLLPAGVLSAKRPPRRDGPSSARRFREPKPTRLPMPRS